MNSLRRSCAARAALASPPSAEAGTTTVRAAADSWTNARRPAKSFGARKALRIGSKPTKRTFVRFAVPRLDGPVERAVLRLFVRTGTPAGIRVHSPRAGWRERAVTGPGAYSFALVGRNARRDIVLSSKEGSRAPQLVVTTDAEQPASDPGPVATPPASASPPGIGGTPRQGQALTSSLGSWTGTAPTSYSPLDNAVRSGARDSTFGYSRSYGIYIGPQAVDPINHNNRVIRY